MKIVTITCDCCAKEITGDVLNIEHKVHVSPHYNHLTGHSKLIDGEWYSFSGRTELMDLCLPCYNKIFSKVFEYIKEIRG